MYSPGCHTVSNTMTKRKVIFNKRTKKSADSKVDKLADVVTKMARAQVGSTPFADAGAHIGSMFHPLGKTWGRWLGGGIGRILGSGDYQISSSASNNVLTNPKEVPRFVTSGQSNIVTHREYIQDITSSPTPGAFQLQAFPINPGMSSAFPWLSTTSVNFDQYKFHGLIFEFKSTSSDFNAVGQSLGTVIMGMNYNANKPNYTNKITMENAEFAVSGKPSQSIMFGVECAAKQTPYNEFYIRSSTDAQINDLRLSDMGNFQIATQGVSAASVNLGELWCSYVVELIAPSLPAVITNLKQSIHVSRTTTTTANPLGSINLYNSGNLPGMSVNSTSVTWTATPTLKYFVTFQWWGTSSASTNVPAVTSGLLTPLNYLHNITQNFNNSPNVATGGNYQISWTGLYVYNGISPTNVTVNLDGSGVFAGGSNGVDIIITTLDPSLTQ